MFTRSEDTTSARNQPVATPASQNGVHTGAVRSLPVKDNLRSLVAELQRVSQVIVDLGV